MTAIPGWEGPVKKDGTNYVCYKKVIEQGEEDIQDHKLSLESIKEIIAAPKMLFVKVVDSQFSGGIVNLGKSWEIVFESGKWVRYNLDLSPKYVIAGWRLTRLGAGTPLDIDIKSINEMATWLEQNT